MAGFVCVGAGGTWHGTSSLWSSSQSVDARWAVVAQRAPRVVVRGLRNGAGLSMMAGNTVDMPEKLQAEVNRFRNVPDPKLRYQQLLFYAKQLPPMDPRYKVPENKVPGCLSTVHVHVELLADGTVQLSGDSDAQLTKGLIALLINSFSGATKHQVLNVTPDFIKQSGLDVSLTPGRNNGFLNMLATIKQKVKQLAEASDDEAMASSASESESSANDDSDASDTESRPVYAAIVEKLRKLQPTKLVVTDNSAQHAGHAGAKGLNGESHFAVEIVSEFFDGLSLVKRHQLVYTLLAEQMQSGIHALQINAKTPSEVP